MQPKGWDRYYAVVRRIPRGRVTTYGVIARLAGQPRTARHVGWALAALSGGGRAPRSGRAAPHGIPWHRVLGSRGKGFAAISLPADGGAATQKRLLAREGVRFDAKGRVSLETHGWSGPAR